MSATPEQAPNALPALGFPAQANGQGTVAVVRPTPLPKRPKGRWFVGVVLVTLCCFVGQNIWSAFFRYRAYGTVTGRILPLSPPWEGVVRSIYVHEGEQVRQGQLLLTVHNLELQQRYDQLGDELKVAQAQLQAEVAKLKWQLAFQLDQGQGSVAIYYETYGKLLQEKAKLDEFASMLPRAKILEEHQAIPRQEYDQIIFQHQGQEQKVAKLNESLRALQNRTELACALLQKGSELTKGPLEDGSEQLKPYVARMEALQADRVRLQQRLAQSQLCAPANGLVVKIHHFPGTHCNTLEPLVSILQEGSLQVVLYLPQHASTSLAVGAELQVLVEPHAELLRCTVARLGQQYELPPENIKRNYYADQKLLPVTLQPSDEPTRWLALKVGGVVKLPYEWPAPRLGN